MTRSIQYFALIIFIMISVAQTASAEQITTGTLVGEMTDMYHLAKYPSPSYKTVQFSSFDHRSVSVDGPEWFANSDGFGREPVPNFEAVVKAPDSDGIGEYLICDVSGPGAIVRVWTAAIEGSIRLYLDGADEPVYDGPANDFLRYPWDGYLKNSGISRELIAETFYQRQAAYCPVPFEKQCRIVWIGNVQKIHFYQIQIRLYEKEADIVTFKPEDLSTYAGEIRHAARIMGNPDTEWEYRSGSSSKSFEIELRADTIAEALTLTGPGAIERLVLKIEAKDIKRALRQTILHISFDDAPWGQVQSPVGDFFGAAPGINPYNSVPFTVRGDGTMISRFVMPFADGMKMIFESLGDQDVRITGEVLPADYNWDEGQSMHFKARWRIDHGLVGPMGAKQDLPFLLAHGKGVYVGSVSYILNIGSGPHPGGSWWGEGDEKIFVDDDKVPSTFGTGSEDYYNYAWSSPDIFVFPYCAQPRNDGPANRGFVTNNRYHILDPLPFAHRIAFYMEYYPHMPTRDNAYGRIGYHYGRPGMLDDHVVITREDVREQKLPAGWKPEPVGAARNASFYEAEEQAPSGEDDLTWKFDYDNLWSGGRLWRWQPKETGDEVILTVPVKEAGNYLIRIGFAMDKKSGRVSMKVNGEDAGFGGDAGVVELGVPYRTLLRCHGTKRIELPGGATTITLKYEGGPADGTVGLDFIWVQKR